MSDWFNRPVVLEQGNNFDDLSRGMVTQPELASDEFHDSEVINNILYVTVYIYVSFTLNFRLLNSYSEWVNHLDLT